MNANIFGEMASIFQSINRKSQKFQEQLDIANTNMKHLRLPDKLQNNIRDFMMTTQNS